MEGCLEVYKQSKETLQMLNRAAAVRVPDHASRGNLKDSWT